MIDIGELRRFFATLNADCEVTGESVVEFTDVEYYTNQIKNLYEELSEEEARELALKLNQPI